MLQSAEGVAGIENYILLVCFQIVGRGIGIQCHLHIHHFIMILAVIGGDHDLVAQLHIFKVAEIAVGVGSGQNGSALTGNMRAGVAMNRDVALWQAKYGLSPLARDCLVALQEAAGRQGMLLRAMQKAQEGPTALSAEQ